MLPTVRITRCGHQSNNPIIISSSPMGKNMRPANSALGIFRNPDLDLYIPENPEFITGCSQYLSFPNCQYIASLDLDTFPEIFRSAIIRNYDCEKGPFQEKFWITTVSNAYSWHLNVHIFSINLFNTSIIMPFMEQINVFLCIKQETETCTYKCNRKQTCTSKYNVTCFCELLIHANLKFVLVGVNFS